MLASGCVAGSVVAGANFAEVVVAGVVAARRRVLIVTHGGNPVAVAALDEAKQLLEQAGFEVALHDDDVPDEFGAGPEYGRLTLGDPPPEVVMVLGGDGTILRAAEITHGSQVPIVGVNLGHVGFLAEAEREGLQNVVARIADGDYQVEERAVASVTVRLPGQFEPLKAWALNEVTIEKANRPRLIEVGIEVDGEPLSSFGCDGVIMATPTGSTAYAFSFGGPVMWPDVAGIMLIPMAAHALFARPLIVGNRSSFRVVLLASSPLPAILTCDGRRSIELPRGSVVEVNLSSHPLRFGRLSAAPFTKRLVEKFNLPVVGWRGAGHSEATGLGVSRHDALSIPGTGTEVPLLTARPLGGESAASGASETPVALAAPRDPAADPNAVNPGR